MIKTRKFIGVILLIFGTGFVCTIFGSYYLDLSSLELVNNPQIKTLYDAQLTMSKIICFLTSGCLGAISLIVALFTVNRYINENLSAMGVLKAIGYSNIKVSIRFLNIGVYVLGGALLGYAGGMLAAPWVYKAMSKNSGFTINLSFHLTLIILIIGLAFVFSFIAFLFAYLKLKSPVLHMLKKETHTRINPKKLHKFKEKDDMSYLKIFKKNTLSNHKILLFFIGFASFGFSAQIQLPLTMIGSTMSDDSMTTIVTAICLPIGILLGTVTLLLAGEFIINSNKQYTAIMKAFGYTDKECNYALLDIYRIPAYIGFMIGTIYQYLLIKFMISLFADVYKITIPFNIVAFIGTMLVFLLGYELIMYNYKRKLANISLKQIMEEN